MQPISSNCIFFYCSTAFHSSQNGETISSDIKKLASLILRNFRSSLNLWGIVLCTTFSNRLLYGHVWTLTYATYGEVCCCCVTPVECQKLVTTVLPTVIWSVLTERTFLPDGASFWIRGDLGKSLDSGAVGGSDGVVSMIGTAPCFGATVGRAPIITILNDIDCSDGSPHGRYTTRGFAHMSCEDRMGCSGIWRRRIVTRRRDKGGSERASFLSSSAYNFIRCKFRAFEPCALYQNVSNGRRVPSDLTVRAQLICTKSWSHFRSMTRVCAFRMDQVSSVIF